MLWGHLRQETVSGHRKIQQLELRQPPPKNIPAEGGFGSGVKGEGWGIAWQRKKAQASIAALAGSPVRAPGPWRDPPPPQQPGTRSTTLAGTARCRGMARRMKPTPQGSLQSCWHHCGLAAGTALSPKG